MRRWGSTRPVLLAVVLATGLALGGGAAVGLFPPAALDDVTTPAVLQPGTPVTTLPITMQDFDDPQSVEVAVTVEEPLMVRVHRSGTVTKRDCEPGVAFDSGTSTVAIDGVDLLNLSTTVPPWRDLVVGTTGSDVRSLEEEMVRLKQKVTPDGTLSLGDLGAVAAMAKSAGVHIDGGVPRDLLVWLPRGSTRIDACATTLGSSVSDGDPVAQASPEIALSPVSSPPGGLPGLRDLELLDDPIPLTESGDLPADLNPDLVRDAPLFLEATAGTPDASRVALRGTTVLRTPVSVAAVPASSILVADDGGACVFTDAVAHTVTVVGSEFGSSFVLFADEAAPTSVDLALPADGAACA